MLFLGEFNLSFSNTLMKHLCDLIELNHLIKDSTCFKSSKPSCIVNFYDNQMTTFFNSSTVETGLSDHHSLIVQCFARHFVKVRPDFYATGLITTIINKSLKMILNRH